MQITASAFRMMPWTIRPRLEADAPIYGLFQEGAHSGMQSVPSHQGVISADEWFEYLRDLIGNLIGDFLGEKGILFGHLDREPVARMEILTRILS